MQPEVDDFVSLHRDDCWLQEFKCAKTPSFEKMFLGLDLASEDYDVLSSHLIIKK